MYLYKDFGFCICFDWDVELEVSMYKYEIIMVNNLIILRKIFININIYIMNFLYFLVLF